MNLFVRVLVLIGIVAAAGAAFLYWQERGREIPPEQAVTAPPRTAPRTAEPSEPRYPIPVPAEPSPEAAVPSPGEPERPDAPRPVEEAPREPLPPLNESTGEIVSVLTGMFTEDAVNALFNTQDFARRFVVTVDNLAAPKLPRQLMLFKRVPGAFQVTGEGEERAIAAENAERYAPYAQLAQRIETRRLVNMYQRFYPLFQEAYAELGTPNAYFNDRLVEVIDHLLDTPVANEPLRVVQPKVFYQYADPALEDLSAGQKALLRMGNANAVQIKAKLRELRAALTGEDAVLAE